ncbi:MAG: ankyrin repeat domain-containing protein [Schleiferiaceae bacterium]|nr:ankyrin repeat domain-containing protein [Schleiferiaceae bacterium]
MLELLGLLTGIGELANAVSFRRSGSSTEKDTADVTQNALDEACRSKAKLNAAKKEQAETQAKLEVKKNELSTNQEYSKGVFRDKGDKQKVTESEIIVLEDKLKENKQTLKKTEQEHKANVEAANRAVKKALKSKKNLQNTNPLSAHQAAYIGDTELFKKVNKKVALSNKVDGVTDTPLHTAVLGGNKEIILTLAEKGADFSAQNKDGQTPIHLAAQNPNYKSTHRDIDNIIEVIPELSPVLDIPDAKGKTALHYAAERGDLKTVGSLIEKGADPNALDNQGKTPLASVPKNATEVQKKLVDAVHEYSPRISEIANIDQRIAERDEKERELDGKKTELGKTQDAITTAKDNITETQGKLKAIKKKQGYIDQLNNLPDPDTMRLAGTVRGSGVSVDVNSKDDLKRQKEKQEATLKQAKEKVAEIKKEQKSLPKEIAAVEGRIAKKDGYTKEISQLENKIKETQKEYAADKKKKDKKISDLEVKKSELEKERDAIKDTDETKAGLQAKLDIINKGAEQEDSLAHAKQQEHEAQRAISFTQDELDAIEEKEKRQAKINDLKQKRDAVEYNGESVDVGDKKELENNLNKSTNDLKDAEIKKNQLSTAVKEKQKELDKQNKEIERIEGIIKDAPGLVNIAKPKALNAAIASGNREKAKLFGHTDLHMKAGGFKTKDIQITDANKDVQNINSETPLHVAAKAGNKEMADNLLANNVDLHLKDREGKTPLHVATEHGNGEIVEALVKKDHTLLQAQEKYGKTPVDIAIEQGNAELLNKIKDIPNCGITDENIKNAETTKVKIEEAKKLEEEKAREEEIKIKEQEQSISGKSELTEEQKAKMAANAPARDAGQQQRSSSTGHAPQDHQGQVWKEENFKNENGVKTCTIGDTSQGHFKQTRTADGKFEYEVQNTGNDEPDRIQVLKVPREGSNPKLFDIVKFDREGNVVGYQEGKGGASKIGPETMKKIKAHEESLSKALVSDEKAKPPVNKGPEKNKLEDIRRNVATDLEAAFSAKENTPLAKSIRERLEAGEKVTVKERVTPNIATQQRKQSKGASR